jgi:hypothetical protein
LVAVYVNDVSPTNGPGTWKGTSLEPVKAPQIRKIARIEMTDAARSGVTALSSPKVTVLRLVKSWRALWRLVNRTTTKASAKSTI